MSNANYGMDIYNKAGEKIDMAEYGRLLEDDGLAYKRVGFDELDTHMVSTVWLGVDHRFGNDGPPLIFETMIFAKHGGDYDWSGDYTARYSTLEEAESGHVAAVQMVTVLNEANQVDE